MAVAAGLRYSLLVTENADLYVFGINDNNQILLKNNEIPVSSQVLPRRLDNEKVFGGAEITMVAAGPSHGACVTRDGCVWTWGSDNEGQLGIGRRFPDSTGAEKLTMAQFGNSPAIMVTCGRAHTMVLTAAGRVWAFGATRNSLAAYPAYLTPTLIDPLLFGGAQIGMISALGNHSMALQKEGGVLWSWGSNRNGQLGLGEYSDGEITIPTRIDASAFGGAPVLYMSVGYDFTMVVTVGGVLWSCGCNEIGELGLGNLNNHHSFQRVGGPELFGDGGVRLVTCGFAYTLILTMDKRVFHCGSRKDGPLVDTNQAVEDHVPSLIDPAYFDNSQIVVASVGYSHAIAVTAQGRVYTWGRANFLNMSLECGAVNSGMGYVTTEDQRTPMELPSTLFQGARIGRYHRVCRERVLAFVMGLHARLGDTATFREFPDGPLEEMFQHMRLYPSPGTSDALDTFLGHLV